MTPLAACKLFLEKATLDGAPQADLEENGVADAIREAVRNPEGTRLAQFVCPGCGRMYAAPDHHPACPHCGIEFALTSKHFQQTAVPHEGDILERKTQ